MTVSGVDVDVADRLTVAALVRDRAKGRNQVAVAVNAEVVPRSQWEVTRLGPGDSIELLAATARGRQG